MKAVHEFPAAVEVVIEVPRGSPFKREWADGELVLDYVSPVPSPFNYGCVPDTPAEDGDPLDAIVLGSRLPAGHRQRWPVVGVVRFVDAGATDDKLVVSDRRPSRWQRHQLDAFFHVYVRARQLLNRRRGIEGETRYDGLELREE